MNRDDIKKDMTVYELAQLMMGGFGRLESKIAKLEENSATKEDLKKFATKQDLEKMEARLNRKIDRNYMHANKRVDLLSEKIS